MNVRDIQCLVETLDSAQISEFDYMCGPDRLHLRFLQPPVRIQALISDEPTENPPRAARQSVSVRAQRVGTFCRTHPLIDVPPIEVGSPVTAGQHIGYIRVGQVFFAVLSPLGGVLSRQITDDEKVVGFGDVLIEIDE